MPPTEKIRINRQAVVLIHGIGEQNPMDTLREFAVAVVPPIRNSDKPAFYSKPDTLSSLFELRRITANAHRDSFKTDYFEFYWAHLLRDTRIWDVLWWIWQLLVRKPGDIPRRLQWLYWFFWISILIVAVVFASMAFEIISIPNLGFPWPWKLVFSAVLLGIDYFLIEYLGDAARYMTPRPRNIAGRQAIRQNGIGLLRSLHERQEDGRRMYDRIILIGHSLGSVIAYDLIKFYWSEVNWFSQNIDPEKIAAVEEAARALNRGEITETAYRAAQFDLWKAQQSLEPAWLISDFITLGSPLAHAKLFLAKNPEVFEAKKQERELPTGPPEPELIEGVARFSFDYEDKRILHHAAPFALTRWTNAWFANDFIGGPVDGLGRGVENQRLRPQRWLQRLIPFASHTEYWDPKEEGSIKFIRDRMELRFLAAPDERGGSLLE